MPFMGPLASLGMQLPTRRLGARYVTKEAKYMANAVIPGHSRAPKTAEDAAATKLQASWRGSKDRVSLGSFSITPHPGGHASNAERTKYEEKMRAKMAAFLYPKRADADKEQGLQILAAEFAMYRPQWEEESSATETRDQRWDIEAAAPAAAAQDDTMEKAAVLIQAKLRGLQTRASLEKIANGDYGKGAVGMLQQAKDIWLEHLKPVLMSLAIGGVVILALIFIHWLFPWLSRWLFGTLWEVVVWILLISILFYAWLRLPYWLGQVGTLCLAHLALWGYPMGMEAVRVRLWLGYSPLRLHVDIHAVNFYMKNPPGLKWRSPNFISAKHTHILLDVELAFLNRLRKGLPAIVHT